MSKKQPSLGKAASRAERSKIDVAAADVIKLRKSKRTSSTPVFLSNELELDMTAMIRGYLKTRIARPIETIGYAEVARRFNVCQNTIRNWINKAERGPVTLPAPSPVFPNSERVGWNDKLIDAIQVRLVAQAHGLDWAMFSDLLPGWDELGCARQEETSAVSLPVMNMMVSSLLSRHAEPTVDSPQRSAHAGASAVPIGSRDKECANVAAVANISDLEHSPKTTATSAGTDERPWEMTIHPDQGPCVSDSRASEAAEPHEPATIDRSNHRIQPHPTFIEIPTRQPFIVIPTRQSFIHTRTQPLSQ
jgi:hypothetical protein